MDARAPLHLLQDGAAVRCRTQCRRCKGMNTADVKCLNQIRKAAQDFDHFLDAVTDEMPLLQIACKPDGMLALHEEVKRPALDLVDRHADGVRPNVDDGMQHDATASARCRARGG